MKSFITVFLMVIPIFANNPIINHMYTADPAALVYNDTFYIYTGHDEGSTGYVMRDWYVYSSTDLVHWIDHGPKLKVSDFSWAAQDAWASQVIENNGKFYWYVCAEQSGGGKSLGVAVADHPLGPYKDARGTALITNQMTKDVTISWDDIDPTVFVDDDGQAYLYWGNTSCKGVKLKSDMINTDGAFNYFKLKDFTEAPWLHKRNDRYYLSFAAQFPEYIDYAMSDSPLGPWTYKGRILEERLPSETSHQAIVQFKNKWYFVYHNAALPGGGPYKRSVCIDELFYNEDGSIKPIKMTSAGVSSVGTAPVNPDAQYHLLSRLNNKALDVRNGATSQGANIQMGMVDENSKSQLWSFEPVTNGVYKIINAKSGMCMSVESNSTKGEANVEQRLWEDAAAQKWKLVGVADSGYAIVNLASGKCLDILDLDTQDGANIIIWDYWYSSNQQWLLKKTVTTGSISGYHQRKVDANFTGQGGMQVICGDAFIPILQSQTTTVNVRIIDLLGRSILRRQITGGDKEKTLRVSGRMPVSQSVVIRIYER